MTISQQSASSTPPVAFLLDSSHYSCQLHLTMRTHTPPNTHRARILRFADADTLVILIEGMWGVWTERYLRLEGIESWELDSQDKQKATDARDSLNIMLAGRDCLVHLRSHGHDRFGRLIGHITVGETDLAERIVELKLAWHVTTEESRSQHKAARLAALAVTTAATGCYVAKDSGVQVFVQPRGNTASNGTAAVSLGDIEVSPKQSATLPTHALATSIVIIVIIAVVAGIGWLVHNRGKLAGFVASVATKL